VQARSKRTKSSPFEGYKKLKVESISTDEKVNKFGHKVRQVFNYRSIIRKLLLEAFVQIIKKMGIHCISIPVSHKFKSQGCKSYGDVVAHGSDSWLRTGRLGLNLRLGQIFFPMIGLK